MSRGALALAVALLVAACSSGNDVHPGSEQSSARPTPQATTASGHELPCAALIGDGLPVPGDYESILDVVALPTADSAPRALQVGEGSGLPTPGHFAKTGLLVRAGSAFKMKVHHPPDVARIGWGSPAEFGSRLSSAGCRGEGWIAVPGGFLVREPMCVELVVMAKGTQETVHVGAGSSCEGQQPPMS